MVATPNEPVEADEPLIFVVVISNTLVPPTTALRLSFDDSSKYV